MTFRKQPRQFRISHLVSVSVLALTLGGAAFWSDSDYASTAPALSYAQEDLNARADLRQREGVLSGVTPSLSLLDAPAAAREEATASSEELTVEDNVKVGLHNQEKYTGLEGVLRQPPPSSGGIHQQNLPCLDAGCPPDHGLGRGDRRGQGS